MDVDFKLLTALRFPQRYVLHIKHNIEKFSGSSISCLNKCSVGCRNPYFSPASLGVYLKTVLPQQASFSSKSSLRNMPIPIYRQKKIIEFS